ncbi:helix-turn-helix transcriptional regulator [Nonomuraea rubra]|uniref:AraC-like DNA-binding protein n=1 Tax=Nonomuraea rubra TaxID=46180 RepID=A0A7X0NRY7_9ACTN|nr:helix-turn-helix transcriptional regulator [Nonomuraea rubra]MBB6548543.1 AraC-like DNA-binding protein [Nonomuraea rubra]
MSIHSLPGEPRPGPYRSVAVAPGPHLRPYVLGWAGFRAGPGGTEPRTRMLPLNAATLIVDFAGGDPIVTGPRSAVTLSSRALWRHGVAVGLTPAGMSALLGTPMREVAGTTVPLADLLGAARAEELTGRLMEPAGWQARFGVLERWLAAAQRPAPAAGSDGLVMHAWHRLQQPPAWPREPDGRPRGPGGRLTVEALAGELGVSRRYLELGFRRLVGLTPKTVARVARFQRAVHALSHPSATLAGAVACGYADQPHLTREVRTMAGMTPKQLFAFVQDTARLAH